MADTIPTRQQAAVKQGNGHESKITVQQVDVPEPGPSEILVKINWSDSKLVPSSYSNAPAAGPDYAAPTSL
jgi:hypothetical protein